MLQRVQAEIDLARCFGVVVNSHDAALFAKLGVFFRDHGTRLRAQGIGVEDGVGDARDILVEQPGHANTSS
jgi:hypothetical protein